MKKELSVADKKDLALRFLDTLDLKDYLKLDETVETVMFDIEGDFKEIYKEWLEKEGKWNESVRFIFGSLTEQDFVDYVRIKYRVSCKETAIRKFEKSKIKEPKKAKR